MAIPAGNNSLPLGTPAAPTLSTSGSGSTLGSATYYVKVVALTLEGYQNSSVLGGVATSKGITGADNKPYSLSDGSSNISPEASQAVTSPAPLLCSVTPVHHDHQQPGGHRSAQHRQSVGLGDHRGQFGQPELRL